MVLNVATARDVEFTGLKELLADRQLRRSDILANLTVDI